MTRWLWLIGAIASLILVSCQSPQSPSTRFTAQVSRVVSGQVIELANPILPNSTVRQIRLAGIQTPDLKQVPWGPAAKQHLQALIQNQPVHIVPTQPEPDDYDRLWADVWVDHQHLNATLVREGYALVDQDELPRLTYGQSLVRSQERARLLGLGIWDPQTPLRQTPTEFRQQQKRQQQNSQQNQQQPPEPQNLTQPSS